nr:hypothetical protein [Actinomycetota bacterium]
MRPSRPSGHVRHWRHVRHVRHWPGRSAATATAVTLAALLGLPAAASAAGAGGASGTAPGSTVVAPPGGPMRAGVPMLGGAAVHSFPADSSDVRIAMTENDTGDVIVTSAGGVSAPGVADAKAVLFHPQGGGVWSVST